MARGRPKGSGKKQKQIPKEVVEAVGKDVIDVVIGKNMDAVDPEMKAAILDLKLNDEILEHKVTKRKGEWDYSLNDKVEFFDSRFSYELSGYKPITETQGLDFDPKWFTAARDKKVATGHYCQDRGKAYRDFWLEEIDRCRYGYTVNGYTLTGDNYFFLNYYQLKNVSGVKVAGQGRNTTFPSFYSKQYEYFHYIDICERLKKDVCALKARGVGFSEIAASLGVRPYTVNKGMHVVYTAFIEKHLKAVLRKCWDQLEFLNLETDGGLRHIRQKYNSDIHKRASKLNKEREESGWMSEIMGILCDNPRKLRGDRIDRLFFEEAGSNPYLVKTYLQGNPLVEILGEKFGTRFVWGTGGDSGPHLKGLASMFNNPETYNILPYRHNYTRSGEYTLSSFFIPAYTFVAREGIIDSRGVTNIEKAKAFYEAERAKAVIEPEAYMIHCAEYCFTPDEALSLEGDDTFNRIKLTEQKTRIDLFKDRPDIHVGHLEYTFKGGEHLEQNISGFKWIPDPKGKVKILEHPLKDEQGNGYKHLYVAGVDGIDMGQKDTSESTRNPSDFCIVIKRRTFGMKPPQIVAMYKDRPKDIREAYQIALRLIEYYNAPAVIEWSKINFVSYLETKKKHNYIMGRPRATLKDTTKPSRLRGVVATKDVIEHYLGLIAAYIEDYSQDIWFIDMINEALEYSYEAKTKFDIIAAWGMVELGDQELGTVIPRKVQELQETWADVGFYYENGIKKYGVIPKQEYKQVKIRVDDDTRIRTSDPRLN